MQEDRFRWTFAALCGGLWGIAVTLADTLSQPLADVAFGDWLALSTVVALIWLPTGLIWTGGAKLAEQSRRPLAWTACVALVAWGCSVLLNSFTTLETHRSSNLVEEMNSSGLLDASAYLGWMNLFYGGLYVVGYFATRRAMKLRRRLNELRQARTQSDTRLGAARLTAFRDQMQPALLLEALSAMRRAYARDPRAGEKLFDQLITFLRAVMPGLRSGASTLAAELNIVCCYAALREALEGDGPRWRVEAAEPPGDITFPALRLLPALDQIGRCVPADTMIELDAAPTSSGFVVRIGARAQHELPEPLLGRLRRLARLALGPDASSPAEPRGALLAQLRVGAIATPPLSPS